MSLGEIPDEEAKRSSEMSRTSGPLGVLAVVAAMGVVAPAVVGAADNVPAKPTFTKDIAPIFQEKCEACHRRDSIAPMWLVTYEDVRPWAPSIKAPVEDRQIPTRDVAQ